jgi:hypothetical protein
LSYGVTPLFGFARALVPDLYTSLLGKAWIRPVCVFVAVLLDDAVLSQELRADRGCRAVSGWNQGHDGGEPD